MKYNPDIHHRRSIRLNEFDYAQAGLYFITICVRNRASLFGHIDAGEMILNGAGLMVERQWLELTHHFDEIKLHECVVMPNHFHGIIELVDNQNALIGEVIGAFKSLSTNEYIHNVNENGWQPFDEKLWQRNFYEHIIRNDESYLEISEYIQTNPLKWQEDEYYNSSAPIES